jgi:cobyrinic acid a,c-diamide synthase
MTPAQPPVSIEHDDIQRDARPAAAWLVAAPRSGSGKTTVTLGIVAAMRRRGVAVRTAKSGPDYVDPAFHAAASGAPGTNLDSWAMPPPLLDRLVHAAASQAELLIVESAMGLFDGVDAPPGRSGSSADLAARYGLPVLLVLDISGQAQTAAAIARGFMLHDPAVRIGGVILNRVASDRHRRMAEGAIAALGLPVLGAIPRDATLTLPERHLGLVQASEHAGLAAHLDRLAAMAEAQIDLSALLTGTVAFPPSASTADIPPPGQRIALAQDAAFTFVYPHVLAAWRAAGAEFLPFSPLADEPPPPSANAAWLPGGYPELHAGRLAAATRFHAGLRHFATSRPVHGECGGYMALGAGLIDAAGVHHAMTGLLGHTTSFATRKLHLGYREAILPGGTVIRGHEFHYATLTDPGADAPYAMLRDSAGTNLGPAGGRRGRVTGSFFHAIAREAP